MGTAAKRTLGPAVWVVYVLIVLEFLFMISPIALTFYSAYGPVLNGLHVSPWTAWLTGFYLPHFSETSSAFLNALKPLGTWLGLLGLAGFLVGAAQIYGAKLLRRGAVTGGLYRWVRHPQYSALAALGLGVALVWPRFLVLGVFVTMTFLYVLLAHWEEQRCVEAYGDPYRLVIERTGMFLPRRLEAPFRSLKERLGPWTPTRVGTAYLVAIAAGLSLGFGSRELTLARVSSHYRGDLAVLSPALLPEAELREALVLSLTDAGVGALTDEAGAPLLVYVVPEPWYMPDLPLHSDEEIRRESGGHGAAPAFPRGRYKVLFTRTRTHSVDPTGADIVRSAYAVEPLVIVHVDLEKGRVVGTSDPPRHVIWGDIPTPRF